MTRATDTLAVAARDDLLLACGRRAPALQSLRQALRHSAAGSAKAKTGPSEGGGQGLELSRLLRAQLVPHLGMCHDCACCWAGECHFEISHLARNFLVLAHGHI